MMDHLDMKPIPYVLEYLQWFDINQDTAMIVGVLRFTSQLMDTQEWQSLRNRVEKEITRRVQAGLLLKDTDVKKVMRGLL
jgi:L-asparaginase/Glu-tRNA(Gln) amidotransferase subunit D